MPIIPALLLSVVCDSWEKDISSFAKLSTDEISQSLNKILEKFYDDTIDAVIKELSHQNASLSDSDSIRKDIDVAMFDLVDVNGKRVRVKAVTTHGTVMFKEKNERELKICKYKGILGKYRIIKIIKVEGEDYVEIIHDALCSVIANKYEQINKEIADNAMREIEEAGRKKRKILYQRMLLVMCMLLILVPISWWYFDNMPTTVTVGIKECPPFNNNLPPLKNAIIKIKIGEEEKIDTIYSLTNQIEYTNIPQKLLGESAFIRVESKNFIMVDTTIYLRRNNEIVMQRDPKIFGNIRFRLWDIEKEKPISHAPIEIEGYNHPLKTDEIGRISINIPIEQQRTMYHISYSSEMLNDTLYMPCGDDDVLFVNKRVKNL